MQRPSKTSRSNTFDEALGALVRRRRHEAGMTQRQLAAAVGVTYPQIQKYERGDNRVSVYMLAKIAVTLGFPMSDLAPDLPPEDDPRTA